MREHAHRHLRTLAGALSRTLEPVSLWMYERSLRGTIFLLHRVSEQPDPAYPPLAPAEFARHCEFFRSRFEVIPLAELLARRRAGQPLARLAAITFDDGYRDFLTEAYPILQRFGLPCTHFLVEDCVRTGQPTWNLRLRHLVPDRIEREARLRELARMTAEARYAWLAERESGAQYPAMLSPSDLGRVDAKLVSWQSHTASHALLNECPGAELERELAGSRSAIAAWTGRPVTILSYPNGANDHACRAAARAAGYEAALAVGQAAIRADDDPFALTRFDVGALPRSMLASEISGLHAALRGMR